MEEIIYHIFEVDSKHIHCSKGPYARPPGCFHGLASGTISSKGNSIIPFELLLLEGGEYGKTNRFHDHGTTVTLL